MSRVLVTGASGFIGRRLVRCLLAAGHPVVAATRRPGVLRDIDVQVAPLDIGDRRGLAGLPGEIDVVVHAAAERLDSKTDWLTLAKVVRVNTLGTLNMLEYAERHHVKRFVYCSTLSAYALPQSVPIREDGLTYPAQGPDSFYAISKLAGELLCARLHQEGRLACYCLRLARVYGPEESPQSLLSSWVQRTSKGEEIVVHGDGQRSLDFLYVDDAVRAIAVAVESDWNGGVVNIGSGVETTWRSLAEAIVEVFSPPGRRAPVRYVPEGPRTRCYLDISQARTSLGFVPRYSLKDGLLDWRASKFAHTSGQLVKQHGSSVSGIQRDD